MKTIDELATEVVEYEYEVRPYEMNDCYVQTLVCTCVLLCSTLYNHE